MAPIKVAGMVRNMANSKVLTTAFTVAVLTRSMLLLGSGGLTARRFYVQAYRLPQKQGMARR